MRNTAIKLFTWKKAVVIITICVGTVSYRAYQTYQQKGRLDSVDWGVAAVAMAIAFSTVAFVGWWANR